MRDSAKDSDLPAHISKLMRASL